MNYTKNYNKILPSVAISKEYRQYEIYQDAAVDRYVNINRYHYMDNKAYSPATEYRSEISYAEHLMVGKRLPNPTIAVAVFKDADKKLIKYKSMDGSGNLVDKYVEGIILPVSYTTSGNSISFSTKMFDNFTASSYPNPSLSVPYRTIMGETKNTGAWVLDDARYVDDRGEATYVSFYLIKSEYEWNLFYDNKYPYTITDPDTLKAWSLDYEEDIRIDKDNRERLCFNYQIHFLTKNEDIKWHPALVKYFFFDKSEPNEIFFKDGVFDESMLPRFYGYKFNLQDERFAPQTSYISDAIEPYEIIHGGESVGFYSRLFGIVGARFNNLTDPENIRSVAVVLPKTNEILFHTDLKNETAKTLLQKTTLMFTTHNAKVK